jgi:hypothetical protein
MMGLADLADRRHLARIPLEICQFLSPGNSSRHRCRQRRRGYRCHHCPASCGRLIDTVGWLAQRFIRSQRLVLLTLPVARIFVRKSPVTDRRGPLPATLTRSMAPWPVSIRAAMGAAGLAASVRHSHSYRMGAGLARATLLASIPIFWPLGPYPATTAARGTESLKGSGADR